MSAAERERLRLVQSRRRLTPAVRSRDNQQRLAYARADKRLREAHRDEFDRYYAEEKHALRWCGCGQELTTRESCGAPRCREAER